MTTEHTCGDAGGTTKAGNACKRKTEHGKRCAAHSGHIDCRRCDGSGRLAVPHYHERAHKTVDQLEGGGQVFAIFDGQFSVVDLIAAACKKCDCPDVSIMSWTAYADDIDHLYRLYEYGIIGDVRFIFDKTFPSYKINSMARLVAVFGKDCLRLTSTHTKIYMVRDDEWDIIITSSANMNTNRRFEQYQVSDWTDACDTVERIFDTIFSDHDMRYMPSDEKIQAARVEAMGGSQADHHPRNMPGKAQSERDDNESGGDGVGFDEMFGDDEEVFQW